MLSVNQLLNYSKTIKIIAAIPCFNTGPFIQNIVLKTKNHVDEVVVIDDGSSDMTAFLAKNVGAFVISHPQNRGYGEALKSCFTEALNNNADIIITLDGDGQHDPDQIPDLLAPIIKGDADVVIGSRFLTAAKIPTYRRSGISIINYLWNFGHKNKLSDSQSGFRAYRRNILEQLHLSEKGMGISIEILQQISNNGVKIKEIPIICSYENNNAHITKKAISHGLGVTFCIIKLKLIHSTARILGKDFPNKST
jgi:glycosyltransferase involved in cell wall biosynthesis